MHRRELLVALGLTSLVGPSIARTARAGQDADDEQGVDVLFVQTAGSVSLAEGKLRMKGVAAATLFFSDRPERVAGHVPTSVVIDAPPGKPSRPSNCKRTAPRFPGKMGTLSE